MPIGVRIESFNDAKVLQEEELNRGIMFCYHDQIIGRLIMARSISNQSGSEIHIADGFDGDVSQLDRQTVERLATDENLHTKLLPWFETSLPVHLDTGEEANLSIRDIPYVVINVPHTDASLG